VSEKLVSLADPQLRRPDSTCLLNGLICARRVSLHGTSENKHSKIAGYA
jgi:hypothetical protein